MGTNLYIQNVKINNNNVCTFKKIIAEIQT